MLSDIGSWASIIGLLISLFVANKVYKISTHIDGSKKNNQKNKFWSLFTMGNTKQKNDSHQ